MKIVGTSREKLDQFLSVLSKEVDRGAALTAAAFAEEMLDNILRSFLADVPETKELTTGFAAPIGTLAAKAKLAYALGLLDDELYKSINTVRKIRNEFAHQWKPMSFDMQSIHDLVSALPSHPILNSLPSPTNTRETFDASISAVLLELHFIPEVIEKEKRCPRRLIRFGRLHNSKEEADAENDRYRQTGIPPWSS